MTKLSKKRESVVPKIREIASAAELTTQEAADFLNVSRPFLIQLFEKGKIHFRKVGRHRWVLFEDLVEYRERSKGKSRKMREKLTEEAQDLGIGY